TTAQTQGAFPEVIDVTSALQPRQRPPGSRAPSPVDADRPHSSARPTTRNSPTPDPTRPDPGHQRNRPGGPTGHADEKTRQPEQGQHRTHQIKHPVPP